jgi:hypothetical protein
MVGDVATTKEQLAIYHISQFVCRGQGKAWNWVDRGVLSKPAFEFRKRQGGTNTWVWPSQRPAEGCEQGLGRQQWLDRDRLPDSRVPFA